MKKTGLRIAAAVLLLGLLLAAVPTVSAAEGLTDLTVEAVGTSEGSKLGQVAWWLHEASSTYYLFLPNEADPARLTVHFSASGEVKAGEKTLLSGQETDVFTPGQETVLTCAGQSYRVITLQTAGIPSVYIDTESGNLNAIHADKEHKEPGTVRILGEDGTELLNGSLDYIKGRGNSTWTWAKKPYNIKLSKKADLFGMGKAKKWCLLANMEDHTFLRNEIALSLARQLGIAVTPEGQRIALYINEEYQGLYYLTEKVEVGSERVDIDDLEKATEALNSAPLDSYPRAGALGDPVPDTMKYYEIPNNPSDITGGYLLEFEAYTRYAEEASGFVTTRGQSVILKSPEAASQEQVSYIRSYYQEFEDALYSPTGYNDQGRHYSDYADMDSIARSYLLQEFTENYDGCNQSFYLYKPKNGKLIYGPAWDFDTSLGRGWPETYNTDGVDSSDPEQLWIKVWRLNGFFPTKRSFLGQCYLHSDFQAAVSRIWKEEMLPYATTLQNTARESEAIFRQAMAGNMILWDTYQTTDLSLISQNFEGEVGHLNSFLEKRIAFLSRAFDSDTFYLKYDMGDYNTTLLEDNSFYSEGMQAVVQAMPPGREGTVFEGWTPDAEDLLPFYQAGDLLLMTGNIKLHAAWAEEQSLLRFDAAGGAGAPEVIQKTRGEQIALPQKTPTRTGYRFLGWNAKRDGSGTTLQPGDFYSSNQNHTLYALWEPERATVSFLPNGGQSAPQALTKTYGEPLLLPEELPLWAGHRFLGWNTRPDGTGDSYAPGDELTAEGDLQLYAQWEPERYTLIFDEQGGVNGPGQAEKIFGQELLLPDKKPTRAGYRFLGWNTRSDGTGDSYAPGARYLAEGDAILYAQWADEIPNTDGDALLPLWIALAIDAQGGWLLVKRKKAMKNEK